MSLPNRSETNSQKIPLDSRSNFKISKALSKRSFPSEAVNLLILRKIPFVQPDVADPGDSNAAESFCRTAQLAIHERKFNSENKIGDHIQVGAGPSSEIHLLSFLHALEHAQVPSNRKSMNPIYAKSIEPQMLLSMGQHLGVTTSLSTDLTPHWEKTLKLILTFKSLEAVH
jgi:hypothetical protein